MSSMPERLLFPGSCSMLSFHSQPLLLFLLREHRCFKLCLDFALDCIIHSAIDRLSDFVSNYVVMASRGPLNCQGGPHECCDQSGLSHFSSLTIQYPVPAHSLRSVAGRGPVLLMMCEGAAKCFLYRFVVLSPFDQTHCKHTAARSSAQSGSSHLLSSF